MKFEKVIEKHDGAVTRALSRSFKAFGIPKADHEAYRTSVLSDLWINTRDLEEVNASFVINSVKWSCYRVFRESHIFWDKEDSPEIELFSEEYEISSEMCCNNRLSGLHSIGGLDFPYFSEMSDLDKDDHAVIQEFLNTPVADRSRRSVLRRRVDLILLKIGIDSSEIHEYTSRQR